MSRQANSGALPTILFCGVAGYFLVIGVLDISYSRFEDLPWDAGFFEAVSDPSQFDRPVEILTTWIGILLIVAAGTLLILAFNLRRSEGFILAAAFLAVGVLVGQLSTLWVIGAPRLLLVLPSSMAVVSIGAVILAWHSRRDTDQHED